MNLLLFFTIFAQIGLFAVGGGLATLPFLFDLADKSDWLTREMVGNMLAVAQSLPGAIGVNTSAYTGFRYMGITGALCAVLGLISPSIIIITIVARILTAFGENTVVKAVFSGLRPAAAGLLAAAGFGAIKLSLYKASAPHWYELLRWRECILFAVLFLAVYKFKKNPVIYIAAAGIAGVVLGL
ncbi:MAG: chromate transporter [Spirochaetaceae bacterium]|jgi:chromate transporter|nr:chromate transporter [Spirochaetaceae bacterium]